MKSHEKAALKRTGIKVARASAAIFFGVSAILKLFGFSPFVNIFADAFDSALVRYAVGLVELTGTILVARRRSALVGAAVLLAVCVFAAVHVVLLDGDPLPVLVMFVIQRTPPTGVAAPSTLIGTSNDPVQHKREPRRCRRLFRRHGPA